MSTPSWLVAKPIAHRGLHNKAEGIIENTISAAEAAIARGFPIELDVQLTADNEA
ncbi:MAG: glycerophosphodiester phosphodiesterase family protein, partial [Microvirga sp.]